MENIQSKIDELVDRLKDWKNNLDLTNSAMSDIEKQLQKLKQEVVSRNNQQTTINSVEDAFNLLKPEWYLSSYGDVHEKEGYMPFPYNQCNMTSEKRAKQIKALIQLHLVAEAMNKVSKKYINNNVFMVTNDFDIREVHKTSDAGITQPTFATPELAEEALEKFKPLFKDLYLLND